MSCLRLVVPVIVVADVITINIGSNNNSLVIQLISNIAVMFIIILGYCYIFLLIKSNQQYNDYNNNNPVI